MFGVQDRRWYFDSKLWSLGFCCRSGLRLFLGPFIVVLWDRRPWWQG